MVTMTPVSPCVHTGKQAIWFCRVTLTTLIGCSTFRIPHQSSLVKENKNTAEPCTSLFHHTASWLVDKQSRKITEVIAGSSRFKIIIVIPDILRFRMFQICKFLVQFLRDPLALLFYQLHILTFAVFSVSRYPVRQDTQAVNKQNTQNWRSSRLSCIILHMQVIQVAKFSSTASKMYWHFTATLQPQSITS